MDKKEVLQFMHANRNKHCEQKYRQMRSKFKLSSDL